jgi:2-dehydropantoate 2-reductase
MEDRIFIIGYGAIGKALAVFLTLQNRNVVILRGSVDDRPADVKNIQLVVNNTVTVAANVEVSTFSNFKKLDGIVVLTNKSFGNAALSKELKSKAGYSPIVLLQNGLGIEKPFIEEEFSEIYRCVLFVTSQNKSDELVSFKPVSSCPIGIIKGNVAHLNHIVQLLNTPDFQFRTENNIETITWKKAIANIVFNSICPLLDVDNGIFHRDKNALRIAERVIKECLAISSEKGIRLTYGEVMESVLMISKGSDGQLISTLQDIRSKRPTEIDTLNFELVRIAGELDRESQVPETKLLGELIKLKSEQAR